MRLVKLDKTLKINNYNKTYILEVICLNKKRGRLLACAVAMAVTNFTLLEMPVVHAQTDGAAYNTVADSKAPQTADNNKIIKDAPGVKQEMSDVDKAKKDNAGTKRIDDWQKQRPVEKDLAGTTAQYNGLTVVKVAVTGLKNIPEATVLEALKTKAGGEFSADNVAADRQAIYDTGFFYDNFPAYEVVPEGIKVTYHVLENPILNKVNITGNKEFTEAKIKSLLALEEGKVINTKTVNTDIANVEAEYRKEGYILAKVNNMSMNDDGVLNIDFNEGIVEGYTVKGNDKTKAKVITREMRMKPGDAFNAKLAKRSMQRIYNLGFFQDVNMKLLPGQQNPNNIIIETTVVEKRTGSFGIGAGYSSSDGFIGMVSLSDSNLRGTGDSAKLTYEFGGDSSDDHGYTFSYRHPWLDSKETSLGLRLYDRTYQYDDYNTQGHEIEEYDRSYKGGEISLGRPANEYTTNFVTLKIRDDQYDGHESGLDRSNEQDWINSNFGTTRSITLAHVVDTRDNIYNPSEGSKYSASVEAAGLGGDFSYDKYMLSAQRYFNLGHSHVLALRFNGGYSDSDLPESGRFEIGGQTTLRGYKDDQFKGNNMITGSVEYRFPIVKKVQGALFFDMGDAWEGKSWAWQSVEDSFTLHHSYGIGFQIETPVGPLRLDYGIGEDGGRTHFSVGGTF